MDANEVKDIKIIKGGFDQLNKNKGEQGLAQGISNLTVSTGHCWNKDGEDVEYQLLDTVQTRLHKVGHTYS
jgi:hypothetical protein